MNKIQCLHTPISQKSDDTSKKYWCPTCGNRLFFRLDSEIAMLIHREDCRDKAIPVHTPLVTPEPTTWGESGGDEVITLHDSIFNVGSIPRWMVGDNVSAFVDHYSEHYWMAEHGKCLVRSDVIQAMNFLERTKK